MSNITAAQVARQSAALAKPFYTDTLNTTYGAAIADGTIAYGRIRTFSDGKRTYGVVLASDVTETGPANAPFYDAPKYVVDACPLIVHV